ncbi:MAG: sulfite exporter TauE/SafE family protein [Pseudomonadota bacterium]
MTDLLPDLALQTGALIFVVFVLAGFVKGVVGVGMPTIAVGLLTASIGLQPALALMVVPTFITNLWQGLAGPHLMGLLRRLWSYLLAATLFTGAGVALLVWLNHPLLPLILAASLIGYGTAALMKFRMETQPHQEVALSPALGAMNGLLMGLTGSGTVPGIFYFDSLALGRDAMVQAMGLLFLVITGALAITLAALASESGSIDSRYLTLSALCLIPSFIGIQIGAVLRHRLSEARFRQVLYIAIIAMGVVIAFRTL